MGYEYDGSTAKYLCYFVVLQVRCKILTLEFTFTIKSAVCLVAPAMKSSEILRGKVKHLEHKDAVVTAQATSATFFPLEAAKGP